MPSPSKTNASADDMEDELIEELEDFDKSTELLPRFLHFENPTLRSGSVDI